MKQTTLIISFFYLTFFYGQDTLKVNSLFDLKKALLSSKVIIISGSAEIDFSNQETIKVPKGTVLMSDRGVNGSLGALLYSNNFGTRPMFSCEEGVTIKGLRIQGPDEKIRQTEVLKDKVDKGIKESKTEREIQLIYVYGIPNSVGVKLHGENVIIDNCEIYGWSLYGIEVAYDGKVEIKNNYIHHNQRYGLGYGILVEGDAEIHHNKFDYNRHAIASSGKWRARYHAHHNICLENSGVQSHIFDVHGGVDRKDGTDTAGQRFIINDNVFFIKKYQQIFRIRGRSLQKSKVYNNYIFLLEKNIDKDFVIQSSGKGNLEIGKNQIITLIKE